MAGLVLSCRVTLCALALLSLEVKGNTIDNAGKTDVTTAKFNGTAINIILAGLMGFLLLIIATVILGTCVICICLRVCKSRRKHRNTTDADISATAHSVILEQNPAYDCVPVHLKPTGNEYQEFRRGYPPSSAQGNIYA